MNDLARFSVADAEPDARFRLWCDRLHASLGDFSAEAVGNGAFEAAVESAEFGEVRLCRISAGAQRVERTIRAGGAAEGDGMVHLLFPLEGRFFLEQNGRTAELGPGDWGFYDTARSFVCGNDAPVRLLALMAPRSLVFGRDVSAYRCTAERFPANTGAAAVARSYLISLLDALPSVNPLTKADLAATAVQLVRLVVSEALRQKSVLSIRDMLRARIESYVSRNLRNPQLTVDMIAAAHDCTKRYVHKIFSGEETLGQHILNVRLDRCREDLQKPEFSHLSITEIAFSWGFNSSAHFSRVFRRRFGVSPSACRSPAPAPTRANGWGAVALRAAGA